MHKLKEPVGNKCINLATETDMNNLLEWSEDCVELNYKAKILPNIFPNYLYWAHLGYSIGSEQAYDRPVLTVDSYKTSPVCIVLPVTLERLGDERDYHIDLSNGIGTALVEQIRTISKLRIFDYVFDKHTRKYATINEDDREKINEQLSIICQMKPLFIKK